MCPVLRSSRFVLCVWLLPSCCLACLCVFHLISFSFLTGLFLVLLLVSCFSKVPQFILSVSLPFPNDIPSPLHFHPILSLVTPSDPDTFYCGCLSSPAFPPVPWCHSHPQVDCESGKQGQGWVAVQRDVDHWCHPLGHPLPAVSCRSLAQGTQSPLSPVIVMVTWTGDLN